MNAAGEEIRASAFTLVDEHGRDRGGLSMTSDGPQLRLADESGKVRFLADVTNGNPRLLVTDDAGVTRIGFDCYPEGPSLFLRDSEGVVRIGFDVSEKYQAATVSLSDAQRRNRVQLVVYSNGKSSVSIYGADKTMRALMQVNEADSGSFTLADPGGVVGFIGETGGLVLSSGGKTKIINVDEP